MTLVLSFIGLKIQNAAQNKKLAALKLEQKTLIPKKTSDEIGTLIGSFIDMREAISVYQTKLVGEITNHKKTTKELIKQKELASYQASHDTLTGLIWQRCNLGQTWDSSTKACLNFSEPNGWRESLVAIKFYNDDQEALGLPFNWRMPNIKELTSIVDLSCANHTLDENIFLNAASSYWSSTPNAANVFEHPNLDTNGDIVSYQDLNNIWAVNVLTGRDVIHVLNKSNATLLVRNPINP